MSKARPKRGSDGPFIQIGADLAEFVAKDRPGHTSLSDEKWDLVKRHMHRDGRKRRRS